MWTCPALARLMVVYFLHTKSTHFTQNCIFDRSQANLHFAYVPRRWFRISGLSKLGLFDGISKWFAADNKCGAGAMVLSPGAEMAKNPFQFRRTNLIINALKPFQFGKVVSWRVLPANVALLGFSPLCVAVVVAPASLIFGFEFDVVIGCCGNFSEAENERNGLFFRIFLRKLQNIWHYWR